jgi:hypothetical protein
MPSAEFAEIRSWFLACELSCPGQLENSEIIPAVSALYIEKCSQLPFPVRDPPFANSQTTLHSPGAFPSVVCDGHVDGFQTEFSIVSLAHDYTSSSQNVWTLPTVHNTDGDSDQ